MCRSLSSSTPATSASTTRCSPAGVTRVGAHFVNLDDDGQNPPKEAARLWKHAVESGMDVVFGHYDVKQHNAWRNFGGWFTNKMTDWALDKPSGFTFPASAA